MWSARSDNRVFVPIVVLLAGSAWVALAVWGASPAAYLLDHENLGHTRLLLDRQFLVTVAGFVAGWNLMVLAMMLPTIIPLLGILGSTAPASTRRVTAGAAAGYVAVWSIFGVLAHSFDFGVHRAVESNAWLHSNVWLIGTLPVLVGGIYQFTPLKHLCLEKCRSPFSFVAARWRGRSPGKEAFRVGVDHGLFCLGCCWALMLLMFAMSMGNLAWMLALAAVMGIEKNFAWGQKLTAPVGVVLLSAGTTLVVLNV
jgi:predicted metal-binding membrane protein